MRKEFFRRLLVLYAVQGEFRRYDGINLLKHALHNTIPDINKSKEMTDKVTGETKTIKVRDGHAIQMANAKIEEIRQGFVDWLGRTPDTFKQQLSDRYNRLFNCFVRPNFDGTHQTFPDLDLRRLGIADLYKSQKDAVWMLKTNGGGICDHEVGAGKTLHHVYGCLRDEAIGTLKQADDYRTESKRIRHCRYL